MTAPRRYRLRLTVCTRREKAPAFEAGGKDLATELIAKAYQFGVVLGVLGVHCEVDQSLKPAVGRLQFRKKPA